MVAERGYNDKKYDLEVVEQARNPMDLFRIILVHRNQYNTVLISLILCLWKHSKGMIIIKRQKCPNVFLEGMNQKFGEIRSEQAQIPTALVFFYFDNLDSPH